MPPPSQQQSQDNSLAPIWILIGFFVLFSIIWYFFHEQIAHVILLIKYWEARLISLVNVKAGNEVYIISNMAPGSVTFSGLSDVSSAVGSYLRYPAAIILGILAVLVFYMNPTTRFKKTYSMQKLVESEREIWPQITPVAKLNLVTVDIDEGPWAMALSPMQFAKKNQLLQLERVIPSDSFVSEARIIPTLRREEAQRIFTSQLGRYWRGIEHLNIHTRALFAIFAARANRDRDGATALILQIANSANSGKLNFSGVDALLKKHKDNKAVVKVTQKHAFVLTIMASMLQLARTDGVLASADFLWLKPLDRPLWFMLNTIGRQTVVSEVAGPYAHWLAEVKFGRKLMVPMVEEAVNGLEAALKDIVYIPDENEQLVDESELVEQR